MYNNLLLAIITNIKCCDGFHNALKSVYTRVHPTMWKFLKDIAVHCLVHQNALVLSVQYSHQHIKLAQRLATRVKMYRGELDKLLYLPAEANMQAV